MSSTVEQTQELSCNLLNLFSKGFDALLKDLDPLICDHLVGYCPKRRTTEDETDDCLCTNRIKFVDLPLYKKQYESNLKLLNWNPTKVSIRKKDTNSTVEYNVAELKRVLQEGRFAKIGEQGCLDLEDAIFGNGFFAQRLTDAHAIGGNQLLASELAFQQIEDDYEPDDCEPDGKFQDSNPYELKEEGCIFVTLDVTWGEFYSRFDGTDLVLQFDGDHTFEWYECSTYTDDDDNVEIFIRVY
jgi:hypothetical protein